MLSFLESIGVGYQLLDLFMKKVRRTTEPVELAPLPYACTAEMRQLVHFILSSEHSPQGRAQMLRHHISAILIAALEVVSREEGVKLPLSRADKAALHEIRELIEANVPAYLTNEVLLARVFPRLNAFKPSYGFKRLFGANPYDYYQALRFAKAKELLEKGEPVAHVAYMVEYESATGFIKAFKDRYGVTPKQWMKG